MRTAPQPAGWRLGPLLTAGLILRQYAVFAQCKTQAAYARRIAAERPEFNAWGIHVMASQNGLGEVIIGDSHEYGLLVDPFDKTEIDRLILEYLQTFLAVPGEVVYIAPNTLHRMVNLTDDPVRAVWGRWAPNGDRSVFEGEFRFMEPLPEQPPGAGFRESGR